jgi:hypothetical protein
MSVKEALDLRAAKLAQHLGLLGSLHTLRRDGDIERFAERDGTWSPPPCSDVWLISLNLSMSREITAMSVLSRFMRTIASSRCST